MKKSPTSEKSLKLSRTGLELFTQCPRCFYLDKKLGIKRVSGPAFTLNSAVDALLKNEFDRYRKLKKPHPLMKKFTIDAIPFQHSDLDIWRSNFKGVRYKDTKRRMEIFGAVDDIWVNRKGELVVVDYKATAKQSEVDMSEDKEWYRAYERQMEVYQWLLRKLGFKVSNMGYFVYVNGRKDLEKFDGRLEFDMKIIPYKGSDTWVGKAVDAAYKCLGGKKVPKAEEECEWCSYVKNASKA